MAHFSKAPAGERSVSHQGVAILSLLFFIEGNLQWLGLIGVIPIITGTINFCPLYALLGINTNK